MENNGTKNRKRTRLKTFEKVLIVITILLFITGIVLLLIEPIKRLNRRRISEEAVRAIEQKIEATEVEVEMTYVVPVNGNEVAGEEYDFIDENEEITEEEEYDGETVTLNSVGILSISRINIRYSVWDEATKVSLRYGLGHYPGSVMPGQRGNAAILGHNYKDGTMFHNLGKLKVGDAVKFTGLDGKEYTFYVVESKIISADNLMDYVLGNITDARQLTLVTCTYEYGRYGWRRVVICRMDEDEDPVETVPVPVLPEETTSVTTTETTGETATEETSEPSETTTEQTETTETSEVLTEPTQSQTEETETTIAENTP